ncbi:MAG TPA: asparagine synthase-related protein [Candidatus Xenobia bacterium]|jgi:asparagine synthase (glutamine-hydrolysing)
MSAIWGALSADSALPVAGPVRAGAASLQWPGIRLCHWNRWPASELLATPEGLAITASLRLDNRDELIRRLGENPSVSDSHLVLRAYQRFGTDCVGHLLGDFAFALWDGPRRRLFCARDFIGVRPFYYVCRDDQFTFASDIVTALMESGAEPRLDLAQVRSKLQNPSFFFNLEHTFYQHVRRLPPGHFLLSDGRQVALHRYWTPPPVVPDAPRRDHEVIEQLRELLDRAVSCRLSSAVGVHLSGGLDSSLLAALARHRLPHPPPAFCWSHPDEAPTGPFDERELARTVAREHDLTITYTELRPEDMLGQYTTDITTQPHNSLAYESVVSREASARGLRTMISGWGGDEFVTFDGQGYHAELLARGQWRHLVRELTMECRRYGGRPVDRFRSQALSPWVSRFSPWRSVDLPLPAYLQPDFRAALLATPPLPQSRWGTRPGTRATQLHMLSYGHLTMRLEDWANHGVDLGLDYVFPLLDRRLVEFALGVPGSLFLRNGWRRYLIREATAGLLPEVVRWNLRKDDPGVRPSARDLTEAVPLMRQALLERGNRRLVSPEMLVREVERLPSRQQKADRGYWLPWVNPAAVF